MIKTWRKKTIYLRYHFHHSKSCDVWGFVNLTEWVEAVTETTWLDLFIRISNELLTTRH